MVPSSNAPKQSTPAAKPEEPTTNPPVVEPTPDPTTDRIVTNKEQLAADRPGFHCGYCGQPVGPEGQHWTENGDAVPGTHAGTLVVADNWPANQETQDEGKRATEAEQREIIESTGP